MHKKIMLACMAIAAFAAFVIAPAASASPDMTEGLEIVPPGTLLTATNTGEVTFTGAGGVNLSCNHVNLTKKLTKNSGTVIEGEITTADFNGTGTSTDCTSNLFNAPAGVTMPKLCFKVSATPADTVVYTGCGAAVTFTLNFTGVATCKYSKTELRATFTTGSLPITVNNTEEFKLVEGGSFCPSGSKLDMTIDNWTFVDPHEARLGLPIT
ncbi:MAG: hypothetical protein ACTHKT_06105 [Solirubrobacterales bacterium]